MKLVRMISAVILYNVICEALPETSREKHYGAVRRVASAAMLIFSALLFVSVVWRVARWLSG